MNTKIFCFDLDGTICTNTFGEYELAKPLPNTIRKINLLFEQQSYIKIFTARGGDTGKNWEDLTKRQLSDWGVKYHELILGKPNADFYIDDRAINMADWIDGPDYNFSSYEFFHSGMVKSSLSLLRGTKEISKLVRAGNLMIDSLRNGNKVMWCGNGGSAADSQHLAAELVGRFAKNRAPLSSIALTTDSSILTALGNDFGFENIFARQIEAIGKPGDVIVCISTSGESANVISAALFAKQRGISTIAFTGKKESSLGKISDISINAQSQVTSQIQESHICWGQLICGYVEHTMFA